MANAEPGYVLSVIEAGTVTRSIRRSVEPIRATRALAIAELGEGFKINFGRGPCTIDPAEMVDGRGYAETIPMILNVLLSPEGELWVERRAGAGAAGSGYAGGGVGGGGATEPPGSGTGTLGSLIDLFDASGAYRGTLPPGTPFPIILLPGGRFGVVEKDEFDVARLVVMQGRPEGAETR